LNIIWFLSKDIHEYELPANSIDGVFFHQSLQYFKEMDTFVKKKVVDKLKSGGYSMVNEYVGVNRLQYPKEQIKATINV
jgi:hypothetical protein